MSRPREFNETQALEQATQVFWAKGYEGTSLCDLIDAMDLSKSSFYETFGSKHELFLATIDHYNKTVSSCFAAGMIDNAPNAKAGIAAIFNCMVDKAVNGTDKRGCYTSNCAIEVAPHCAATTAKVAEGFSHLETALHNAVQRGQKAGEISDRQDALALARYLSSSMSGLTVMAKAGANRAVLEDIVSVVLTALD